MININAYIYQNGWQELEFVRPVSGSNKLDETLDTAILTLKNQPAKPQYKPFTPIKIVVSDGTETITNYYVLGNIETIQTDMSSE